MNILTLKRVGWGFISLGLFLLGAGRATAAEEAPLFHFKMKTLCPSREEFQPTDCPKNKIFVEAGNACYQRVQAESKAVAARLDAMNKAYMKTLEAKGMSAQDQHFHFSEFAYKNSQAASDYLQQVTAMARKEVLDYQSNLWPPEDYDSPWITQGDQGRYLMTTACYGEPKLSIDKIIATLDQETANLKLQKSTAMNKQGTASGHRVDLGDAGSPAKVTGSKAIGSALPVPKGTTPKSASDISGTKKAAEDAAKAKAILQKK